MIEGPERLLAAVVLLGAAAAIAVAASASRDEAGAAQSREAQQATGGLGLGTSLAISGCARGFDPRLDPRCGWRAEPEPGGGALCPHHHSPLPDPR